MAANIRWNEAHAANVLLSLELHVFPLIGKFPVSDLKTAELLIPLRVAERKGTLETAARIQQRTTAIMRCAVPEEKIDLAAVNSQLVELEQEIAKARDTHNAFLKELGLPPLP